MATVFVTLFIVFPGFKIIILSSGFTRLPEGALSRKVKRWLVEIELSLVPIQRGPGPDGLPTSLHPTTGARFLGVFKNLVKMQMPTKQKNVSGCY